MQERQATEKALPELCLINTNGSNWHWVSSRLRFRSELMSGPTNWVPAEFSNGVEVRVSRTMSASTIPEVPKAGAGQFLGFCENWN